MPNTRRRKFSVHNDIGGRDSSKMQNGLQVSHQDHDIKTVVDNQVSKRSPRSKNKMFPNSSKNTSSLEIVAECASCTSASCITCTSADKNKRTLDKNVTASSTSIDLFNTVGADDLTADEGVDTVSQKGSQMKVKDPRSMNTDKTAMKRDKYPRQHRIKIRSPRRKMAVVDQKGNEMTHRAMATDTIDWELELEVFVDPVTNFSEPLSNSSEPLSNFSEPLSILSEPVTNFSEPVEEQPRVSNHSLDDMCRICHGGESLSSELGQLISACSCRGTVGRVHVKCLERWLTESGKSRCELCGTRYVTRRVHRYGVPRALLMWVLSQNAKQLMVDSLGIMLMSPLAVLAAWLSGRTLAGLMTQDSHATPWPLASTFVLACMTLVCYYCWIVSAATRHALGWWIWYRSQYEVRLQFQETEE